MDARDDDGRTPLLFASQWLEPDFIRLLLATGAEVNLGDHQRRTPLLESAQHGDVATVKCLLESGANACGRDIHHRTAVIEAATRGAYELLLELLTHVSARLNKSDATVYVNSVTRDNRRTYTAVDLAKRGGHKDCADLLWSYGGEQVELEGYTVWVPVSGDCYHRYECGAISHGRFAGNLEEIEITSSQLDDYEPCEICHPTEHVTGFNWSC